MSHSKFGQEHAFASAVASESIEESTSNPQRKDKKSAMQTRLDMVGRLMMMLGFGCFQLSAHVYHMICQHRMCTYLFHICPIYII